MPFNKNKNQDTVSKTIRIPKDLNEIIESLAIKDERDFSKQVILNKYGSLDDLCATVGKLTGLPITVDSPAASSAVKTTAPKESDLDAQLEAALGTSGKRPANAAVGVVPQSRSRGMRIAYEGTVKG